MKKLSVNDVIVSATANRNAYDDLLYRAAEGEALSGDKDTLELVKRALDADVALLANLYRLSIRRRAIGAFLKWFFAVRTVESAERCAEFFLRNRGF